MIGATLAVGGKGASMITDVNGEFTFSCATPEASLEIRSIGYEPQTVKVSAS